MNRMAERIIALIVMVSVSLGAAAGYNAKTAIKYQPMAAGAGDSVMTVNGDAVGTEEYAAYMLYNMKYYQDMYSSFGMADIWDDPETAAMMGGSIPEAAKEQAVYTHVVLQKMNENKLKLSYQKQKEIANARKQAIEQAGGEDVYRDWIATYGFDETSYNNFMYASQCYATLNEYYFGENGVNKMTDEDLLQHYRDDYINAKHILIQTVDSNTGEQIRSDDEARQEAQELLDRINNGEDFDELMKQYSEDAGLQSFPDGYVFTEGEMMEPFYEGAKALEIGEVSEPVQTSYGYHIIKREPLDETKVEDYREVIAAKLGQSMEALLNQWINDADVQTTELYDEITYENVKDYSNLNKKADSGSGSSENEGKDQSDEEETKE